MIAELPYDLIKNLFVVNHDLSLKTQCILQYFAEQIIVLLAFSPLLKFLSRQVLNTQTDQPNI